MLTAILAALLVQIAPQEDPGFTDIWIRYGSAMEAEGITRRMAAQAYTWTEGQYHLGLCRPYLEHRDVTFWREWWKNTPLEQSVWGRRILEAGSTNYTEGLEAAATQPITAAHCQRIADSWLTDMKRLAEEPSL
jgi:hypothetical protein